MKVLVAGGHGFIGRALCARLRELGGRRGTRALAEYADKLGLGPVLRVSSSEIEVVAQRGRDPAEDAWLPDYLAARLAAGLVKTKTKSKSTAKSKANVKRRRS